MLYLRIIFIASVENEEGIRFAHEIFVVQLVPFEREGGKVLRKKIQNIVY